MCNLKIKTMETPVPLFVMPSAPVPKKEIDRNVFKAKPTRYSGERNWDKVTFAILVNEIATNANEALKYTGYYKHGLKRGVNLLMPELIKAEIEEYDNLYDSQEQATKELYSNMHDVVKELCDIHMIYYPELKDVLKAFKSDPNRILSIAKKINN